MRLQSPEAGVVVVGHFQGDLFQGKIFSQNYTSFSTCTKLQFPGFLGERRGMKTRLGHGLLSSEVLGQILSLTWKCGQLPLCSGSLHQLPGFEYEEGNRAEEEQWKRVVS